MIIAQSVPLGIDRGSPRLFTIEITGIDLTNADLHAQIRLSPDAPGDPVVDLPKVTSGTVPGVRLVAVDTSGTLPISWIRLQIPAMDTGTDPGQLPPAAELGDDVPLYWDMIVTPNGFTADRWFFGPVTVRASVTNTGTLAPLVDDPLPGADAVAALAGADLNVTLAGAALIQPLVDRADGSAAAAIEAAAHADTKAQVATDAANEAIEQVGLALPKAGGKMTGPIDMNSQPVEGLPDPDSDGAATNRRFVNTAVTSVYSALSNFAASITSSAWFRSAILNMGGYRIESLGDADSDDDAVSRGYVKGMLGAASQVPILQLSGVNSAGDAITASAPTGMTSYASGQIFYFFAPANNVGPATLNIGGLGAMPIVDETAGALAAGDLLAGKFYLVRVTAGAGGSFRIVGSFTLPRRLLTDTALLGNPTATTKDALNNTTALATTAFAQATKAYPLVQLMNVAGTGDAITAVAPATVTGYVSAQIFYFFASAANTGPVTLNVSGLGAAAVQNDVALPLVAGDLEAGKFYLLRYTGGAFRLIGSATVPSRLLNNTNLTGLPTAPTRALGTNSTGIASTAFVQSEKNLPVRTLANLAGINDLTADMPIAMTGYVSGQIFLFQKNANNTGPVTLNIGGLGALPVQDAYGAVLAAGDLVANGWYLIRCISATAWKIVSPYPLPKETVAALTGTIATAIAPLAARGQARVDYGWSKNLIADPYLDQAGSTVTWSGIALNVVTKNGMRSVEIPAQGSVAANRRQLGFIDLSGIPDGTPISISVVITEKLGVSTTGHRLRLYGFDASNAAVALGGLTSNDFADPTAYSRNVPAASITRPKTIVIWEGIPKPAGLGLVALDMRIQDSPATYISGFLVREGSDPTLNRSAGDTGSTSSSTGVVFLSTSGSDNANGTQGAPLAKTSAAIAKLGGRGTIIMLNDGIYGPEQRIDPTTVTGKIRIIGARGTDPTKEGYPQINMAPKLTGITKTAGQTKVYQVQLTSPPTNANFNWAYQDGVADPRTLITSYRRPEHRGRLNRLHWATKRVKTTATALAAAKAEIDASDGNDPRAFIDDSTGILYFSIVGGGDATAASIYMDAATGLFSTAPRESCGEIEIQGVEVRYGGANLSAFRRAHVDEFFVFGSAINGIDASVLSYGTLEIAAAGSQAGTTGDGLNIHARGKIPFGNNFYGHDCQDDGCSPHEGCSLRLGGGTVEYNGGTGLAPAFGADCVFWTFWLINNCQIPGRKPGQLAVVGGPSSGNPADGGYDTIAEAHGCITIGGTVGFYDDGASASARLITVDCKAYDFTLYGYDVSEAPRDCSASSTSGSPKSARTPAAKNTTLVA